MIKPTRFTAVFSLVGGEIDTSDDINFTYNSGQTPPSDSAIDTKLVELQAEYSAQTYARNRATGYPSIGDQMDMMYKDNLNSTTTHKDAVEAVKTKWPKNNSGPGPEVIEEPLDL